MTGRLCVPGGPATLVGVMGDDERSKRDEEGTEEPTAEEKDRGEREAPELEDAPSTPDDAFSDDGETTAEKPSARRKKS